LVDVEARRAGVIARFADGSLLLTMGKSTTHINDEAERGDFINRAIGEFCSGQMPIGMMLYSRNITDS
jgi:hypothetical protein